MSAPIIFLVLANTTGALGMGNVFLFGVEEGAFPLTGDQVQITVTVNTKTPINAVGGTVVFPPENLEIVSISRIISVVDLWSEEPEFSNALGTLHFSGGIVGAESTKPLTGNILTITMRIKKEGKATVTMRDTQLLASNGEGTNIISGSGVLALYAHNPSVASPDVNGDGTLTIADANTLYLKTFRTYDAHYDLNNDGKVSWADVKFLIGLF